jgi:Glycogen recognition site of AMP-activated protein kinase
MHKWRRQANHLPQRLRKLICISSRDHPAEEVYVTGTFDNWSKSEKLVKTGDVFEKNVTLSSAAEKIYYKVRGGITKTVYIDWCLVSVSYCESLEW